MGWYEEHILPHCIDLACGGKPTRKQREKVVPLARGEVLEIGMGSGLNLPYYDIENIRKVWALEPSEGMRRLARKRLEGCNLDVEFIDLPGEQIPLEPHSVDTVLVTYTLCTIPDAVAALEGMRRVLKPGGRLLYSEHGRAPDDRVRRWQNRLNPLWRRAAGGCNLNRDIPQLILDAGFRIDTDERMYIPGARVFSYHYWGSASPT
jgi:SAM-dependent methyltransferase